MSLYNKEAEIDEAAMEQIQSRYEELLERYNETEAIEILNNEFSIFQVSAWCNQS